LSRNRKIGNLYSILTNVLLPFSKKFRKSPSYRNDMARFPEREREKFRRYVTTRPIQVLGSLMLRKAIGQQRYGIF